MAGHRHRGLKAGIDALLPGAVIIPDRAPGDAGGEARLERRAAWRVIAAEADGDDADALWVDVAAPLQIIDAGAAGLLVVVAQRHAAEADRLAGAGAVHHQHPNAALHQVGHAAQKLDLLGDIEAVEEHDTGRARGLRVLGRHEIARKFLTLERHIDDFDFRARQRHELMEAFDRSAIGVERALILRRAKALAHLIVVTGAQIERRRRYRIAISAEFVGAAAHDVGDVDASAEPRLV